MSTMKTVTKIYTMSKVLDINESKRDGFKMDGGRGKGMGVGVVGYGAALHWRTL
jgi:hypothetical protein